MFNLFKKRIKIHSDDYEFLRAIVEKIPSKYNYLKSQISEEFILDKKKNELGKEGTYSLILNANLERKFANNKLPHFFILKDIDIWNKKKNSFDQVELHILEGMVAGFRVISNYEDLDLDRIEVTKIKEKKFENEEKEKVKCILGITDNNLKEFLNIENSFKIEIPEGDFYVIKELGDGNYIAIDEKGKVYGLIHDPYQVEKIFDNSADFLRELKLGKFNIHDYYYRKMR